jgi:hypothetical protein
MTEPDTPESLLEFFTALAGDDQAPEECQIHYGCHCVIRKGRQAAEQLIATQQSAATPPPVDTAALDSLREENLKLAAENAGLREKVRNLQRQVNRLCDIIELKTIQQGLAKAEDTPAPEEASPELTEVLLEESAARVAASKETAPTPESAGATLPNN